MSEQHWRRLEQMYLKAPINAWYNPVIKIGDRVCEIEIEARREFHHAAQAVHGSVYFKMLDDAGYFAAASAVLDVFLLTSDFTVHLIRPVSDGLLLAKGRIVHSGARQFVCEAELFAGGKLIAHGVGSYARSQIDWPGPP